MFDCKDNDIVEPAGYWKSALWYNIQKQFQLGRLVIVIGVTTLNLSYGEPVATFVRINMQHFRNVLPLSFIFLLKPFFEQIKDPYLQYLLITWPLILFQYGLYSLPSLVPSEQGKEDKMIRRSLLVKNYNLSCFFLVWY